ncbi:MAG: hypothetical protein ACRC1P_09490 [Cellulosilyticaceae bacterium]
MNIGAPQTIYLVIVLIGTGVALSDHGKPRKGNENFITFLIGTAIQFGLMYWGGFFG